MRQRLKRFLFLFLICYSLVAMLGCDAFVRKFTRKPKRENLPKEELVLAPEEYKPSMNKEQLYHQYFLFWQSWQEELIESIAQGKSHKKQMTCVAEAIKNLLSLREFLDEGKQKELDIYIKRLKDLQDLISKDVYCSNASMYIRAAESIKRGIFRDLSFNKVKKHLI